MKYAIYSDIHGNLEALEAVFEFFQKENVDKYICLGDIIGYGANPKECISLVRETNSVVVSGNWEYAVLGKISIQNFGVYAHTTTLWNRSQLSKSDFCFLDALPLVQELSPYFTIVHSTLNHPTNFDYIQTSEEAKLCLTQMKNPICFFGHSHVPVFFFPEDQVIKWSQEEEFFLEKERKYIINVGSVGQPRDENPLACCAIYDNEIQNVKICRIEYNIEKAAKKILKAGLPPISAERIYLGR